MNQHLRARRAAKLVLERYPWLHNPWPKKDDDPRALSLLRANEAVERSVKPNGVTW